MSGCSATSPPPYTLRYTRAHTHTHTHTHTVLTDVAQGHLMNLCVLIQFPDETLRSGELLNMIVAVIDSTQVDSFLQLH